MEETSGARAAAVVEDGHGAERRTAPWPGIAAAGVLLVSVGAFVAWGSLKNGEFTYPLDDPYIHLRLAENLSADFVLGINPGEFASAGSSLVWPALLAVPALVLGPMVGIPLVLATLTGIVSLLLLDRWAVRRALRPGLRLAFLAAVLCVVPMILMSLIGMEHVAQIVLAFFLVDVAVEVMSEEQTPRSRLLALGTLALALAAVRFEAGFAVGVLGLMLLLRRKVVPAVVLGVGAAVPMLLTVAINLGQGWPALPASILAKTAAEHSGVARFLPHPQFYTLLRTPRLVVAVVLVVGMLLLGRRLGEQFSSRARDWGVAALGIFAVHLCFGMFGWLYRYEAYLIALLLGALVVGAESILEHRAELRLGAMTRRAFIVAVAGLLALAAFDGARIHTKGVTGMREVREQQREMARFAAEACPGCRVVVNDIGVVSLFGEVEVTDAVGLSNREVVQRKLDEAFDADALDAIARAEGAEMAMVYPLSPWVPGVPDSWIRIGDWTYTSNEVVGGAVVTFYVIDPSVEARVRQTFGRWDPDGSVVASSE